MTQAELDAAKVAAREKLDAAGYGSWVSDALVEEFVRAVLEAAESARAEPPQAEE